VRVTPGTATVAVGETVQLAAQAFVGLATTSATFTWTSRTPGVATVDATGKVTPLHAGQAWVVATDPTGAADSALVTVVVRQALAFDAATAQLGFHQRWGTGAGVPQVCRAGSATAALPVRLRSLDETKAELPATTVTIAAGATCAPFDVQGNVTAGPVGIVATATPGGGVEWTPDTIVVTIAAPRLKLVIPGSLQAGQSPSVTVQALGPDGFPRLNTEAVPVRLASNDDGVAAWASSTVTIPAGAGTATVSLNVTGGGDATLTAHDTRTADPHRYVTYTQTVEATAASSGSVLIAPATYTYALGQKIVAQRVEVPSLLGLLTLRTISLSSSRPSVAEVQGGSLQLVGGGEQAFWVTGKGLGTTTITASSPGLTPRVVTVEVKQARLKAEGWSGNLKEGDNLRVRFYAAGADGNATNATFATATSFRVKHNGNIELREDKNPSGQPGEVGNSQHDGKIDNDAIIQPQVGARYFTLIVKGHKKGNGDLTIEAPDGSYVRLELKNLNVHKGGGDD
jgi:hypothetical protein